METTKIEVRLEGVAPIMFDKFVDHSKEKRPPDQKMYLAAGNKLVLPAENIYAFLFSENPMGAAKSMEGKAGKEFIRYGQASIFIDPIEIPILDGKNKPVVFDDPKFEKGRFLIWLSGGRTKLGSLSVKQEAQPRPYLTLPWSVEFMVTLLLNKKIDSTKLENWFKEGGIVVGLGTYRPRFGRFIVTKWEEK